MKNSALLIIDVQKGMFPDENPVYGGEVLILNLMKLIKKARSSKTPIIYIQHNDPEGGPLEYGTPGWEIHEDIAPLESDVVIQKTTPDSFYKTELHAKLKEKNIEHLVLAGLQTEYCVDTTCRRASSMDYEVTLVTDAHSTWPSGTLSAEQIIQHHNEVLMCFAETETTDNIEFNK